MKLWRAVRGTLKRLVPAAGRRALRCRQARLRRLLKPVRGALSELPSLVWYRAKGFRIPPRSLRKTGGGLRIRVFINAGRNIATALREALGLLGRSLDDFDKVLDFGCGCGRVFQHVYGKHKCRLYGCDVNEAAIRWMQRNFRRASLRVNSFSPPLPFEPEQFDLIICVSVFTHLDEPKQFQWLQELNRVLRAGGIALVTVKGQRGLENWRQQAWISPTKRVALERASSLDEVGFMYQEYLDLSAGRESRRQRGITGSYGFATHSEGYIRTHWARFFHVLGFARSGPVQDIVLLRKEPRDRILTGNRAIPTP